VEKPDEKYGGTKRKASDIPTSDEGSAQKRQRSLSGRYQRVDPTKIHFMNEKLANNSYYAKGGESWGAKAQADFSRVKGDRFRHEKTKKKRGSYRGGPISTAVNSIPLCSSDED